MKRSILSLFPLFALVLGLAAACGFECRVAGENEPFSSCDDLQSRYDAEQSRLDQPPDNAVLDDLDTCGEANGCEVRP